MWHMCTGVQLRPVCQRRAIVALSKRWHGRVHKHAARSPKVRRARAHLLRTVEGSYGAHSAVLCDGILMLVNGKWCACVCVCVYVHV